MKVARSAPSSYPTFSPSLSEWDPAESVEGTIDPLGLYSIADALGVLLAPGVRERQSRPRFLTCISVATTLCQDAFDPDEIARDDVSEPWQVFEWYVVEALVRRSGASVELNKTPGRDKVTRAIRTGLPVCAKTYLKTPTVFGFHGVYRTLARELKLTDEWALLDAGAALVDAWERDQGLVGFRLKEGTAGRHAALLVDAVRAGMEKGQTDRAPMWDGWRFLNQHLHPATAGSQERRQLTRLIAGAQADIRGELWSLLCAREAREAFARTGSEREVHRLIRPKASRELRHLLDAVAVYERFAALLQKSFDACRQRLSEDRRPLAVEELARLPLVVVAAKQLAPAFQEAEQKLAEVITASRLREEFGKFAVPLAPAAFVGILLAHHREVQKRKPPAGKSVWIEQFDDGRLMLRPGYEPESSRSLSLEFIHQYRTEPLLAFARDLGVRRP